MTAKTSIATVVNHSVRVVVSDVDGALIGLDRAMDEMEQTSQHHDDNS